MVKAISLGTSTYWPISPRLVDCSGTAAGLSPRLLQDLCAGALNHAFAQKIAVAFGIQTVAPPDARAGRLADDFRLVEYGQRQHPARVLQSHEPSAPRLA